MPRRSSPTLQDIAREVGVSSMTVSAVLHANRTTTRVSDVMRQRIREVATRLRYRPNAVARGLSRRRMDTIGVVAIIDGKEINLYFLEVLNGILEEAARQNQNTTIFSVNDWATDEEKILGFCDGRVDGIICIGPHMTQTFADTLHLHTPYVTIHGNGALPGTYDIDVDNEGGAYRAVRYLIEQGHRRIGHVAGTLTLSGPKQRFDGYCRALAEADIPFEESWLVPSRFSQVSAYQDVAHRLIAWEQSELPTALFCASDAIAWGVMEALAEAGLRVPEDMSVIGFDDTLSARMTTPPLTTMRQPFRALGKRSVERLLALIEPDNEEAVEDFVLPEPSTEIFDVTLVVRSTVAPPRQTLSTP